MEICELECIFEDFLMDSITDEQVERVLTNVLEMIRAGAFDCKAPECLGTLN